MRRGNSVRRTDDLPLTSICTQPAGHQPGIVPESLLGRSYGYITGFRRNLLSASEKHVSEYKRGMAEGAHFAPEACVRKVDASIVARPIVSSDAKIGWKSSAHYNKCLNLNPAGRVPGCTKFVPHMKFQGSIGLPFAKACREDDGLDAFVRQKPSHRGGEKCTDAPTSANSPLLNSSHEENISPIQQNRKSNPVELSLKDVDFLHIVILAANKVALPCKGQLCILSALQ